MYRLHANIECQIRLFRWIDKKLWIMQTRRYTTKLHGPKEREIGLPCLKYTWRLKWMKILWYSRFASLFFCLVMTVRKDIWIRTTSVTGMVVFRKDYSKSYLIRAMFYILQTRINILANLSWPITIKRILMKVPAKISLAQKTCSVLQRIYEQCGRWHFTFFIRFFFCPRNLIFKFEVVLIE